MLRRLRNAFLLLVLALAFLLWLYVSLGGDGTYWWDSEPAQIVVGVLSGLCVIAAVAVLVWPARR